MRADEARFAGANGPFGGQGIGFAIPIEQAREVVERMKAGPLSERGYLGVQVVSLEGPEKGVVVVGVKEGGPAEKAGLKQHDVVVRFAGKAVETAREFKRLVLEAAVGKEIEIEVRRGDASATVKAVLEKRGGAK
jgi:serine protease Do